MLTHTRLHKAASGRSLLRSHTPSTISSSSRPVAPRLRVQAAAAAGAAASSPSELRQLLAQKERQLAAMFESGQPMPQASVVAALRAEIAALDDQVNGRPVRSYTAPPATTAAGANSSSTAGAGSRARRTRTEELADLAFDLVEQQLRSNQGMGRQEDAEIAQLEKENSALRAEAYALLQRQQQLEMLVAEVQGSKPPEMLLQTTEGLMARMKAKLQKS